MSVKGQRYWPQLLASHTPTMAPTPAAMHLAMGDTGALTLASALTLGPQMQGLARVTQPLPTAQRQLIMTPALKPAHAPMEGLTGDGAGGLVGAGMPLRPPALGGSGGHSQSFTFDVPPRIIGRTPGPFTQAASAAPPTGELPLAASAAHAGVAGGTPRGTMEVFGVAGSVGDSVALEGVGGVDGVDGAYAGLRLYVKKKAGVLSYRDDPTGVRSLLSRAFHQTLPTGGTGRDAPAGDLGTAAAAGLPVGGSAGAGAGAGGPLGMVRLCATFAVDPSVMSLARHLEALSMLTAGRRQHQLQAVDLEAGQGSTPQAPPAMQAAAAAGRGTCLLPLLPTLLPAPAGGTACGSSGSSSGQRSGASREVQRSLNAAFSVGEAAAHEAAAAAATATAGPPKPLGFATVATTESVAHAEGLAQEFLYGSCAVLHECITQEKCGALPGQLQLRALLQRAQRSTLRGSSGGAGRPAAIATPVVQGTLAPGAERGADAVAEGMAGRSIALARSYYAGAVGVAASSVVDWLAAAAASADGGPSDCDGRLAEGGTGSGAAAGVEVGGVGGGGEQACRFEALLWQPMLQPAMLEGLWLQLLGRWRQPPGYPGLQSPQPYLAYPGSVAATAAMPGALGLAAEWLLLIGVFVRLGRIPSRLEVQHALQARATAVHPTAASLQPQPAGQGSGAAPTPVPTPAVTLDDAGALVEELCVLLLVLGMPSGERCAQAAAAVRLTPLWPQVLALLHGPLPGSSGGGGGSALIHGVAAAALLPLLQEQLPGTPQQALTLLATCIVEEAQA